MLLFLLNILEIVQVVMGMALFRRVEFTPSSHSQDAKIQIPLEPFPLIIS